MKWILIIAWAANGTGYTTQEFDSREACLKAGRWVQAASKRGYADVVCLNKATGDLDK